MNGRTGFGWAHPGLIMAALLFLPGQLRAQTPAPTGVASVPGDATAPPPSNYLTPRQIGMAGAGMASAAGSTALVYNPANLGIAPVYHVETGFSYLVGENAFGIQTAIVDSITQKIAIGSSFRNIFGGGSQNFDGWDLRLGAGMPLSESIAAGVGLRYLKIDGYSRFDSGQRVGEEVNGFTIDAAIRVTLGSKFHIAALAYNLIDLDSSLAPTQVGGSVAVSIVESFSIGADFLSDLNSFSYTTFLLSLGGEYFLKDMIPIRVGYRNDFGRGVQTISNSVGFVNEQLSVEFAWNFHWGAIAESQMLFTLRYHVNPQR